MSRRLSLKSCTLREYQAVLAAGLRRLYPGVPVEVEWSAMKDERGLYSPRLDVAVGPFATGGRCIDAYDKLMDSSKGFLEHLIDIHSGNIQTSYRWEAWGVTLDDLKRRNENARCFLAIEIENKVSRKHLMGGAINAAALGRIGLAVAWTPDKLRAFVRLREYLQFLGNVGKNTFNSTNLLILDSDQLLEAVEEGS